MRTENEVEANGRTYNPASDCAVVICLDGCEPEYLDIAISEGLMPNLKRIRAEGTDALAHSVIPSVVMNKHTFTFFREAPIEREREAKVGVSVPYSPDCGEPTTQRPDSQPSGFLAIRR